MGWIPEQWFPKKPGIHCPYPAFYAEKLVVMNLMLSNAGWFLNTLLCPQCAYTLIINTQIVSKCVHK